MEPPERAREPLAGSASPDALTGRLLDGRYRIGPRVARGGMASVYEATDIRLDRTVAVKVMHPGLGDDDEFAQRFVREARAAARLNHHNVVGVYDQGDDDGTVFLAMEYVPGHTLRDVIRKEAPMAPQRALALLEPVVSALAAAHRAGLIHRDVKPENVLIADETHARAGGAAGQVKVADFGLAKAVSADTQHTATGGVLIGTVSYLAPELVVDGRADTRADVYAAGVVLYELLTGRKPHEGESPIQVAYRHVHEDVPAPSRLVPGIPPYVDALVARATARDRSQRPADAGVLLHQVHRVAQALREGLADDPDLTADLVLPVTGRGLDELDENDTIREPIAPEDLAGLRELHDASPHSTGDDREQTTSIERAVPPAPPTEPMRRAEPPARRPVAAAPVVTTPRRRSAKGPLVFLLSLLLVAGLGLGAWWFGFARYTTTPGVLGMTEQRAVSTLEDSGLGTTIGESAFSESVEAGAVLRTDPAPGDRVLKDGQVTLILSRGPERYDVPSLRGLTVDQAQDALADTNLESGQAVEKYHEKVPEGQVIRSEPKAGTTLKPGDTVDLVVSQGRKPISVKDFTGKNADRAAAALEKRGLVVTVAAEEFSDDVDEGDVISQDPSSGTLFKGDEVSLVVSKGPELVEVPRVIAQGVDAATEELENAGFRVAVENSAEYIGLGFVLRTSPGAGDLVAKGSTITIYLI